jgi:uncharacterized membrane protein YsdA (DUF1294 family)
MTSILDLGAPQPPALQILVLPAFLIFINLAAYWLFWDDKCRAKAGLYRHSESNLLLVALAGGSLGALFAQRRFRHKTRKQPFATILDGIRVLHLGLGTGFVANLVLPI